jgi:hypothetical protein
MEQTEQEERREFMLPENLEDCQTALTERGEKRTAEGQVSSGCRAGRNVRKWTGRTSYPVRKRISGPCCASSWR